MLYNNEKPFIFYLKIFQHDAIDGFAQPCSQGPLSTSRSTLVTAGHVSMHANLSRTEGGSST